MGMDEGGRGNSEILHLPPPTVGTLYVEYCIWGWMGGCGTQVGRYTLDFGANTHICGKLVCPKNNANGLRNIQVMNN